MALPVLNPVGLWDPVREFDDLHDRMSRLMTSVLGPTDGAAWTPFADVIETDDAYLVQVETPGMRREDINVEVSGNELIISGECKESEQRGKVRSRTRRTGRFEYRTTLPSTANTDNISAELSAGVLTVRVPKREGAKPRRISIDTR